MESNGSTALHIACSQDFVDIVRILLNDNRVDRHRLNKDGRNAYQVASTEEIRQLFRRPDNQKNPFCTNENVSIPFEFIDTIQPSNPRYVDIYPSATPIVSDLHFKFLNSHSNGWLSIIDAVKSIFGYDPDKKKFDKWFKDIQFHVEHCLIDEYLQENLPPNLSSYSKAYKCVKAFEETRNVEHLLTLYTLDTAISQYFAKTSDRINCLYVPILFHLSNLYKHAFKGRCFRGLRMKKTEFDKYQHAVLQEKNCLRTNTFCSTSVDPLVAKMFADAGTPNDTICVVMRFDFDTSCSTALSLFSSSSSQIECVSNFISELEVLILPGTAFSVKDIQENAEIQFKYIYLEHYNTDEDEAEMHQDRFQSYIDNIILGT